MEQINGYRFENKSIELVDFDRLMDGKTANILYTDPPWNDGNIKYWATHNKKKTGVECDPMSFKDMFGYIENIISSYIHGYVFIEVGVKQMEVVIDMLSAVIYNVKRHNVLYRSGSKWLPNRVISAVTDVKYPPFEGVLEGVKCSGLTLPDKCIRAVGEEGNIVMDPFCGLGNTLRATKLNGLSFVGNEFNTARLEKTLEIARVL